MKILITLLLLFAVTTNCTLAGAQSALKQYHVEIILFEDARDRYLNSENWNKTVKIKHQQPTSGSDKLNKNVNSERFQSIKPTMLKKQYKRLNVSSQYNVLFYGAWIQAGLNKNTAFEINIEALENTHTSRSTNTLSGTFRLVLSRFLHMHSQLNYHRKIPLDNYSEAALTSASQTIYNEMTTGKALYQFYTYPINSHRRMRSRVLHYIDHPLVGMLIQINPIEKP